LIVRILFRKPCIQWDFDEVFCGIPRGINGSTSKKGAMKNPDKKKGPE
jgi:hypothetical protein